MGKTCLQVRDGRHQQRLHHGRGAGHMDMHAAALAERLEIANGGVEAMDDPLGFRLEVAAGVGQLHMPRRALEQLQPHRFLELLDRGGQRRLRQEHARGREGERTGFHHCQEAAQVPQRNATVHTSFPSGTRRVIYRLCRIIYSKYLFVSINRHS
ncbi:hypothetical protein NB2BOR_A12650 [Bordetella parapertussis]|nr:hypothetical protein NB2BOR_A12650 [Bordetella parapertussis]